MAELSRKVTRVAFGTPSAGVEFIAGAIGGQMFLSDDVMAEDLIRFAGLDKTLAHLGDLVQLDLDAPASDANGVFEDGIYMRLRPRAKREEE